MKVCKALSCFKLWVCFRKFNCTAGVIGYASTLCNHLTILHIGMCCRCLVASGFHDQVAGQDTLEFCDGFYGRPR